MTFRRVFIANVITALCAALLVTAHTAQEWADLMQKPHGVNTPTDSECLCSRTYDSTFSACVSSATSSKFFGF